MKRKGALILEKEYRYWMCRISGFGALKVRSLLEYFGSAEEVWKAAQGQLCEAMSGVRIGDSDKLLFRRQDLEQLLEAKNELDNMIKDYHKLQQHDIHFLIPEDDAYPERLKNLFDLPQGLFVSGRFVRSEKERPTAAIVGARNCTYYGEEMARVLAGELCRCGVDVISGMAIGIDAAAHRGVLNMRKKYQNGGLTFAVLGCGADVCYPKRNQDIYDRLYGRPDDCRLDGGILTEFPVHTAPYPSNFPMRNRIISAMADVVIVIEARRKSGSLITADQALEQGKDVCAVPGRITDPLSEGCNELIRQGAEIITDPIEFVKKRFEKDKSCTEKIRKNKIVLATTEEKVYSCLDFNPKHLGEIVEATGFTAQEAMLAILQLMMKELVVETSKNYYALKF